MGDGISVETVESRKKKRDGRRGKQRSRSLRHTLYYFIPICALLAYLGTMAIGHGTNYLQGWYAEQHSVREVPQSRGEYDIYIDEEGVAHNSYISVTTFKLEKLSEQIIYGIISNAQVLLIPLWVLGCVGLTVWIFYKRELEKPLRVLADASEKIRENCLDFQLEPVRPNELGQLRDSFEKMRAALYQNNQAAWRQLEERKRLNSAFAHDMRTPITVLKGYGEMLERYVPEEKISREKLLEILGMMNGQIHRLENYTQKMSSLQKLEDLEPELRPVEAARLDGKLRAVCEALEERDRAARDAQEEKRRNVCEAQEEKCRNVCDAQRPEGTSPVRIDYTFRGEGTLLLDEALVLEVFENLVSNGLRYAKEALTVTVCARGAEPLQEGETAGTAGILEIRAEDDGPGFSDEALLHGTDPFYREEGTGAQNHFGLGLYICRLICEKCGGRLMLENWPGGRCIGIIKLEKV